MLTPLLFIAIIPALSILGNLSLIEATKSFVNVAMPHSLGG